MTRRLRILLVLGALAGATFNVVSYYVNGWPSEPSDTTVFAVVSTLVFLGFVGVGLLASATHPGQREGLLLTVVGYCWLLPSLANLHASLPWTVGLVFPTLYQATLGHFGLAWPYGRLRSRFEVGVIVAEYTWTIGNKLLQLAFWNPRWTCRPPSACPANLLMVDSSTKIYNALGHYVTVIGIFMTLLLLTLLGWHFVTATGYARRAMTALAVVAVPVGGYILLYQVAQQYHTGIPDVVVFGYGPLLLLAAPGAYLWRLTRTHQARSALGAALVDLVPGPPPILLREALARAIGDPTLDLAFRSADGRVLLDTTSRAVDTAQLAPGRMVTPLDANGDCVLIHDADLRYEPRLVRAAVAAGNLALEHSRLRAEIQAQLEQVRASRARIVEAGDAARRRLERDLHDGAQQRLVTLNLALGIARGRAEGVDPELTSLLEMASKEAKEALVELRELARGIHPAILTEAGLAGALQALVERSAVPVRLGAVPAGRFAEQVEATAYFVVAEALANVAKHAPAATVSLSIRQSNGALSVEIEDNGQGGARAEPGSGLSGLADRVASVGGSLSVVSPEGGPTRIEAIIPC